MTGQADTAALQAELEAAGARDQLPTVFELIRLRAPALERWSEYAPGGTAWLAKNAAAEYGRDVRLADCEPRGLLGALMLAAELELPVGPAGYLHLVPVDRAVTIVVGDRGLVELAYRGGHVKDVRAELVRDGDLFRDVRGSAPRVAHEPDGPPDGRTTVAAYAVARLKTGGTVSQVVYADELDLAEQLSLTGRVPGGPWQEQPAAMWRATALLRLVPTLPASYQLERAVAANDQPAPSDLELLPDPAPAGEQAAGKRAGRRGKAGRGDQ